MKGLWRAIEVLAWAVFFACAATVLAVRFWLLPDVERYREDIVAAVSRTVGQPVKIGRIEAGWLGINPQVNLYDVRFLDAQGREALVLPAIENSIAWRSLLFGELRLHSLTLDGPRLNVRRDAQGDLYVAGMKIARSGAPREGGVADWVLAQPEIVIRNAEVEWRDEKRGAPPLQLSALNLRLRNSGLEHHAGLSVRLPPELGTTLDVRAELSGRSFGERAAWRGRAYAVSGYTDLAGWRAWIDYPLDLQQGQGALRLWATLDGGALSEVTADLELSGVVAKLAAELPPLDVSRVSGRVQAALREGYDVAGRNLSIATAQAPGLQPMDFRATWKPVGRAGGGKGTLVAKQLELQPLAQLVPVLPVPEDARKRVAEFAPRGRLQDVKLEWESAPDSPSGALSRYAGQAKFSDLALNAVEKVPGFAGLSGSVEASEARGALTLESRHAEILLPEIFPDPRLAFDTLAGKVSWEARGPKGEAGAFSVKVASLAFANADLEGRAAGAYSNPGFGRGAIDLTAEIRRADGRTITRYLPRGELMGRATRDYLAATIKEGQGSDGRLRLRGELRDFPFKDPSSGDFQVTARIAKGAIEPGAGWPRIQDIDAQLLFERDRMEITGRSATTAHGGKLSDVVVAISNLGTPRPHLVANGFGEATLSEYLRFVESSPVHRTIGAFTDGMVGAGRGKLGLKLDIPLGDAANTKVAGNFSFTATSLVVHPQLPPVERASGRATFTEAAFSIAEARGRLFGGPLAVTGGTKGGAIEIVVRGDATVAGLQPMIDPMWRRYFSGAAPYAATLVVRGGRPTLAIESSLRGVASTLPPPLAKAAVEAVPLRIEWAPADPERDRVIFRYGALAHGELRRVHEKEGMKLQRGAILVTPQAGQAPRVPERPGLSLQGSIAAFDLDRWLPVITGGPAPAGAPGGQAPAALPVAADMKVGTLDAYGKRLRDLTAQAEFDAAGWSATLQSAELAGAVTYSKEKGGHLVARLTQLSIPPDTPGAGPAPGEAPRNREFPAVDIIAERFVLKTRQLGRLELTAAKEDTDWRISKLNLTNADGALGGKGVWRTGAGSYTLLSLDLDATNAGKLLERLGYPDVLRGTHAKMQASVGWNGDPAAIDYPSLAGEVQLQAEDGQFLEIDPGVGKLLSIMSLQQLPKRLTLDFRDVFSKGFQFDRIRAAAHIDKGVMTLKDFNMRGSAAEVDMSGQVDLVKETQQLAVRVVPQIGDTASTALLFVNPFLFFPAAIAQRILKDPLGHIFQFNYSVSGSWSDPKMERVRVEAKPIPETEVR